MRRDIRDFGFEPDPVIEEYKKHIDRTLVAASLQLSEEERFARLQQMQEFYFAAQQEKARLGSRT